MGFRLARLEPGALTETHLHSFEESFYVLEGTMAIDLPDGSHEVLAGDYGLIPVGVPHTLRNPDGATATIAEMSAPLPRQRFEYDTFFTEALSSGPTSPIDVRDPAEPALRSHRGREDGSGHADTGPPALSASMRTALLVYSGIRSR